MKKCINRVRRKLSNLFRENPIKPIDRNEINFDLRWGMIVPHDKNRMGAKSTKRNISEYEYGCSMAPLIFTDMTKVAFRNAGGVKGAVKHLVKNDMNASFEPHMNAFNKKVSGYECLILKGDVNSLVYAQKFLDLMAKHFPGRKNRGIKTVTR